jgi:preprotein translocase subunit YajC
VNNLFLIVFFVLIVGFMVFQVRSQKKQQKKAQDFRDQLKIGDSVMTQSGMVGKIAAIDKDENIAVLDSEGSKSRWLLAAVSQRPGTEPAQVDDATKQPVVSDAEGTEEAQTYEVEYDDVAENKADNADNAHNKGSKETKSN